MENIFVEFLPPWVETGLQPAFYDKESGTALQQTARMYARVNMLIRMFNKLSKNTKTTVEDYINQFNELHDYVHDYFDNLDVQEEINNKLDDMVEAGTLQEIIADYLNSRALFGYDTVNDMKEATNLIDGSFAQTMGYYTKNDGGGAVYKITETEPSGKHEVLDSGLYAELVVGNEIHTKQFGIVGDGTTDETSALQAFFNTDVEKYFIDDGNILIDGDIAIPSNSIIEFSENAKVTRKTNALTSYFMFNIVNKHDITIRNAHLVGDKDTHTGVTGEWGYGINVAYCYNILIENALIEKTWGDGIYIGASFTDAKVNDISNIVCKNCRVIDCSRNGFAICAGTDIQILDCYAKNITRTAPKSGLDIECEYPAGTSETLSNVYIKGFKSDSCDLGIQIHNTQGDATNVVIDGHTSFNDNYGFVVYLKTATSDVTYRNASIYKIGQAGIYVITVDTTNHCSCLLENISFNSGAISGKRAIWLLGENGVTTGNIIVDNINITNSLNLYDLEFALNIYWPSNEVHNFSNIIFKNVCDTATSNTHRYNFKGTTAQAVSFENCTITRNVNGTVYIGDMSNELTVSPETANTLAIQSSLPNGVYRFSYLNNTNSTDHVIQFTDVSVYNGNTQLHNGTGNKYLHITSNCCELIFRKVGSVISITDAVGVTLS